VHLKTCIQTQTEKCKFSFVEWKILFIYLNYFLLGHLKTKILSSKLLTLTVKINILYLINKIVATDYEQYY